jgi:RNA polymerase sigma-70 factor, ECF subfamily
MDRDETAAIQRVLGGDRDSYQLLMERHYLVACRMAFRVTGNAEDAEEAAQDAFLRAYRKLDSFRHDSNFSTWVNRIALNSALKIVERRSRDLSYHAERLDAEAAQASQNVQVTDAGAGPERILLDTEAAELRSEAMKMLTPMERTAFTLRHMEDLPIAEIAEVLSVSANSAKQAVFRAVSKLRTALASISGVIR